VIEPNVAIPTIMVAERALDLIGHAQRMTPNLKRRSESP
jgi:hypothetical protein